MQSTPKTMKCSDLKEKDILSLENLPARKYITNGLIIWDMRGAKLHVVEHRICGEDNNWCWACFTGACGTRYATCQCGAINCIDWHHYKVAVMREPSPMEKAYKIWWQNCAIRAFIRWLETQNEVTRCKDHQKE